MVLPVLDNNLNFVEDHSEWVGTTIRFEISARDDQTEVRFAHLGLFPQFECYDICSSSQDRAREVTATRKPAHGALSANGRATAASPCAYERIGVLCASAVEKL
jgi:hypothetical protein